MNLMEEKLTKEECEHAIVTLVTRGGDENEFLSLYLYFKNEIDCLLALINEHFDNPPLKYKELKAGRRMNNRQYLIAQLSDENFIDDCGASYEATIFYNINCPYFYHDDRAFCHNKTATRNMCFRCKQKWLDSEIDV